MKVWLIAVGRPGRMLAPAIAEYEARARRYWNLEVIEIAATRAGGGRSPESVRAAESARALSRLAAGSELIALSRDGQAWRSERLAEYLGGLAVRGHTGATFVVGGAFGLDGSLLDHADRRLSLSAFTLPHDLARLVLSEQLYRAGTITRSEPYHKARS